jgi:hypothetical protein
MVIHDLNLLGAVLPHKADSPLIVDPDAPLPGSASSQRFEPIPRRAAKIAQTLGLIQLLQLSPRHPLDIRGEDGRALTPEHSFRLVVPETADHDPC